MKLKILAIIACIVMLFPTPAAANSLGFRWSNSLVYVCDYTNRTDWNLAYWAIQYNRAADLKVVYLKNRCVGTQKIIVRDAKYGKSGWLGLSRFDVNSRGNRLTRCRIYLNESYNLGSKNKLKTAGHEVGHCVGLAHNNRRNKSIMYPYVFKHDVKSVTKYDYSEIERIYPW
jgi:hypothetical protein